MTETAKSHLTKPDHVAFFLMAPFIVLAWWYPFATVAVGLLWVVALAYDLYEDLISS